MKLVNKQMVHTKLIEHEPIILLILRQKVLELCLMKLYIHMGDYF